VIVRATGQAHLSALKRSERTVRSRALLAVLPLFAFTMLLFVGPLLDLLTRSFYEPSARAAIPDTLIALSGWSGSDGPPGDAIATTIARELQVANGTSGLSRLARQVNFEYPGARSVIQSTARRVAGATAPVSLTALGEIAEEWMDVEFWAAVKRSGDEFSGRQYAYSLDLEYAPDGSLALRSPDRRVYLGLFWRTFWVGAVVTALSAAMAYPIAYLLASASPKTAGILMTIVLLPFWTSLLVRTSGWIVILQDQGVIIGVLTWLGLVSPDSIPQMNNNIFATIVAMTHILLPLMVLPIYSVMKTISPAFTRAASSLGARPLYTFRAIYFPLTLPGVAAGSSLVFINAIGFYITPALVGGNTGQLISTMIAFHMQSSLNWSLAAALSTILLATVLVLYWLYNRLLGAGNLRIG